jgi:hypothetical protein
MQRLTLTAVLAGALSFLALPATAAPLTPNQVLKLPSGHIAKILSVSKIEYAKGVMALLVRYETSLSIDEAKEVSQEVDEVWKFAEKDVEHAGYGDAIISSNQTIKGMLLTTNREAKFIFEKGSDGKWTRLSRADFMAAQ